MVPSFFSSRQLRNPIKGQAAIAASSSVPFCHPRARIVDLRPILPHNSSLQLSCPNGVCLFTLFLTYSISASVIVYPQTLSSLRVAKWANDLGAVVLLCGVPDVTTMGTIMPFQLVACPLIFIQRIWKRSLAFDSAAPEVATTSTLIKVHPCTTAR